MSRSVILSPFYNRILRFGGLLLSALELPWRWLQRNADVACTSGHSGWLFYWCRVGLFKNLL